MNRLIRPPKIFWFGEKTFYFVCNLNSKQKFKELIIQLIWILFRTFVYIFQEKFSVKKIPFNIYLKACIFNSFKNYEVLTWIYYGLKDWNQISKKIPNNHSSYIHSKKRIHWPNECQKVKVLLASKKDLYDYCCFKELIPNYIVINKNKANFPSWIHQSLINEGIVLKPNSGYGGKDVFHYYIKGGNLFSKDLRKQKLNKIDLRKYDLDSIINNWEMNTKSKDIPILTPYIKNPNYFPSSLDSVNIRVITYKENIDSEANLKYCWLEIPLDIGNLFINQNGSLLNMPKQEIGKTLKNNIKEWIITVKENSKLFHDLEYSIDNSKNLHNFLSGIDSIAWDWIPSSNFPKLLEGNSDYGLFVPQLIDHLNKKIYNKKNL